jgi:antitoxin YefM
MAVQQAFREERAMRLVTANAAIQNLDSLIADVNDSRAPVFIANDWGKGAVLIGEDDWASIEETLYLNGVSGLATSLKKSAAQPVDTCVSESDLDW